jgi:23S rRNA (uracil1939-C5)-methyltransferase
MAKLGGSSGMWLALPYQPMAAGGDAVGKEKSGRVVLVEGALPGEVVDAELTEEHSTWAKARVIRVIAASPQRLEPPCPHVKRGCGGCGWQHIAPGAQAGLKAEIVEDALARLGGVPKPDVRLGPDLPATGYRTTVKVAVAPGGRPAFRRHGSHELVDVDSCLVSHPFLAEIIEKSDFGPASSALLRCGARTGMRLVVVSPRAQGVSVPEGARVVGEDKLSAGAREWIYEEVAGVRLRVSAHSFFQVRPDGADVLVECVSEALADAPQGEMVDAYGGVGTFGATVGVSQGRRVTLLDTSRSSLADARVNLPDGRVLHTDVAAWEPRPAAVVVADPPRHGLGRKAALALAGTGASHLALVSCDPASLGRDTSLLRGLGYDLEWVKVVDMFPGTPHIEAVARFTRAAGHQ